MSGEQHGGPGLPVSVPVLGGAGEWTPQPQIPK